MKATAVLCVLCCLSLTAATLAQDESPDPLEQVRALYDACDRPGVPGGFAVAIVRDGDVILQAGYGYADYEHGIPFSTTTIFDFASVAKQFTGFAIASLVEEGLLALDDDIRLYLPELHDFGDTIRIEHLLRHTSGLRDWVGLVKLSGRYKSDVITDTFLMDLIVRQRELNFSPGETFLYSNTGYFLLAQIVSRVTGESFREWCHRRIFEPLGMTDTLFLDDYREILVGRAASYKRGRDGEFANHPNHLTAYGSSSLFSTVDDMAKWIVNLGERTIGSDLVWSMMLEPGKTGSGQVTGYGFGLSLGEYDGMANLGHGGSWAGSVSQVTYFPEQHFGMVLASNRDPSGVYVDQDVYDLLLGDGAAASPASSEEPGHGPEIAVDPEITDAYVGWYRQDTRIIRVEKVDGVLLVHLPWGDENIPLRPESETSFFVEGSSVRYSFQRISSGRVLSMCLHTGGGTYRYSRLRTEGTPLGDVEALCGEYYSEELGTTYQIAVVDDWLTVTHLHNEDVTLVREERDVYIGDRWWFSKARFLRNEEGEIVGMRVDADNESVQGVLFAKR